MKKLLKSQMNAVMGGKSSESAYKKAYDKPDGEFPEKAWYEKAWDWVKSWF